MGTTDNTAVQAATHTLQSKSNAKSTPASGDAALNAELRAAAQQKASADARQRAVQARKAVSTGLTKIVNQAGKIIGNAIQQAQKNADLPSRHPGASRGPGWREKLDSGIRRNNEGVAGTNPVTLSDAAIAGGVRARRRQSP